MHLNIHTLFDRADILSVSKDGELSTLETLIPVQLDSETFELFRKHFHPTRKVHAPKMYVEFARHMAEMSAYVNAVFDGLRIGLGSGLYWAASGRDVGAEISSIIDKTYKNAGEQDAATKKYIAQMSSGAHHIIRNSERFKGGKDVMFVGHRGPTKSPLLNVESRDNSLLPLFKNGSKYQELAEGQDAVFNTKLGKAILATGIEIQRALFGQDVSLKSSYSRVYHQHRISALEIISTIQSIFTSGPLAKAGYAVQLPDLNGVLSSGSADFLRAYNSILLVREPSQTLVNTRARADAGIPDESLDICLEAQILQPEICFSFAANLTDKFVAYITQAKDKQPSLAALNTWALTWANSMLRPPGVRTGALYPNRVPMYVLMPSASSDLVKRRKELGLYTEQGRTNEDGLYITDNGDLAFLPKQDALVEENAKQYEALVEKALALSFEAGTPLASGQSGSTGNVFDLASPEYKEGIGALKKQLVKYCGSLQTYNWDLNTILTVSAGDPDRLVPTRLIGANKPDELNLATYMRLPFNQGMRDMFSRTTIANAPNAVTADDFAHVSRAEHTSVFKNFAELYNQLSVAGKVPSFAELVSKAAAALKIKTLEDEAVAQFELNRFNPRETIYKHLIKPDLTLDQNVAINAGDYALACLQYAAADAAGSGRSNLAADAIKNGIDVLEHDRYFNGAFHTLGEFSRLYAYFGGQVFYQAVKALLAVPHADLMKFNPDLADGMKPVRFTNIVSQVMPLCVMLGKYVPEKRDELYAKADEIADNNKHPKVSEDQLNIAGCRPPRDGKPGMQLFPHQAESLSILKNHPKIAVLDIAPGGGKTTIGISDIAMLYADGLIKRPFIFCPNGLVKNWVEDLHKFMEGRWNIIPITTETYATWGDERLTELIQKAPRNTIVVVGNSFLSNRGKVQLVLGNSVESMSDSAEFCKKFEPDYIIIDESHRIKNPRSAIHRGIKTINQMSSVKYGRIATGTLIQNVLSDVVGQSAIYNGQIFRSKDEFEEAHKGEIISIGGKRVLDYLPDAPLRARRRFSEFATVLTYKRKEWAFMLPLPIETFISVRFEDVDDEDTGRQHRMFYDAVLKQTMEELKNDRMVQQLLKGSKGEDDEDDENGDEDKSGKITTKEGTSIDVSEGDDDSESLDNLEAALQPYLQRLERILTDPFGDEELLPVAKEFFNVDRDSFVTAKVRKIIDRIKLQFTERPWQKGMEVKSSDIVDFNGKSYIYRSHEPVGQTRGNAHVNPADDTENWKPQVRGKVIVFCRYTRSVDAIYRALPEDLKKQAVVFHGEVEGNKWENLDRFKSDPRVKILLANEMGISEGHNLQMATRFIRAEAPWAPGELDQSASRIFRPDVGGEYARQTIFMDWILCDGTLEVAKMGRLISKMLRKAQFDELDNPTYYKDLNPLNLPIIKMSLDNIRDLNKMADLCAIAGDGDTSQPHEHSYIGQYQYLVREMASEFREMRKTKRAYMIDVTPTPMHEDARILEFTPWVPNMKVPDRHDEGLVSLTALLQEEAHPLVVAFKKNSKALVGQIVRTEFGLGTIRRVTTKRSGGDEGNTISKVFVDLAQGGSVDNLSASKVYLATKLTEKASHKHDKEAPKITDGDKKRTARYRKQAEEAEKRDAERSRKRAEGVSERARRPKPVIEEPVAEENSLDISLYPVVYNQFLALEAVPADNEFETLKKFGFRKFGNYAWLPVKTLKNFESIWDFLDDKFTLAPKTVRLLESLLDSFQTGRGRKFAVELAPVGDLPMFYRTRHQMTVVKNKRRPELKLYPVIINESLVLVVDIATNPVIRKHLGKVIPGTTPAVKFEEADGLDIMFFSNKSELVAKVKELRQNGFNVTNLDELKQEVKELNLKQLARK